MVMNNSMRAVASRKGSYGIDAPYVPIGFGIGGLILLTLTVLNIFAGAAIQALLNAIGASFLFLFMASYLYTTLRGKFRVWHEILDKLDIQPQQTLLDIGCGRGAVLLMAARHLITGRAHGIDLWRSRDQSGNAENVTRRNAELEGVSDRVELHTCDMMKLDFPDNSFDTVVSSLAIHNIPRADGRRQAMSEAARVLRPGGRLAIADIRHIADYAQHLRELGLSDIRTRSLGWRFWFGGPWVSARLATATKPAK